ncbi:MAG: alpha/beta fold hydrolase [Candidatus Latescibacteria bacterium]|nr:alpha/beta fold hydrolase [Candidatus Latescibacterota bacterium]NIO56888.1 alpha/beta fold hydrolase [Candidatus Latescibacterota bacterium]
MKQKILSLSCCIISFVLIIYSCTAEPDNVAISSDGVKIVFDVKGKGEPALVFVHGWSNNSSIWETQVSHFSKKYKVITMDLPGFGESGNNRETWTIESFGEDVAAVINRIDLDRVVLVGFSMGGPIIIEAANSVPDRVAGLVLVDVLHNVDMQYPPEVIRMIDSVYMDVVTAPTIEKMEPFFRKNTEVSFERVLSMLSGVPKKGWRESLNDMHRWANEDCIGLLKKMQAPVISINSDQTPTNVEAFMKYVPTFKAKIIPDVGHLVMWDAPEEFNQLLEESIQEFIAESRLE